MKVFVLDNSMRESTVGQTTGHTLGDKHAIIEAVRPPGSRTAAALLGPTCFVATVCWAGNADGKAFESMT